MAEAPFIDFGVVNKGATWDDNYIVIEDNAFTLVGKKARMDFRRTQEAPTYALRLTSDANQIVLTPSEKKISWTITAAESSAMRSGRYYCALEIYDQSVPVIVERIFDGVIWLDKEATHD